ELRRSGARAAFGAVDHDEVRRDVGLEHRLDDGEPLPGMAQAELESDALTLGQLAQPRHEMQQPDGRVEGAVAGGGIAVLPRRHAARLGDLGRDLAAGQYAAVARLGALRQLYLDHLHLRHTGVAREGFLGERAVGVAAPKVAGADVPDQRAARLAMVAADAAFDGVVREIALARAYVQGHDGVGGQGAEAHGRDVECRHRIRLAAIRAAHRLPEVGVLDARRHQGMVDPFVPVAVDVFLGAERPLVDFLLGALVDDGALRPREGRGVRVVFQEILADLG